MSLIVVFALGATLLGATAVAAPAKPFRADFAGVPEPSAAGATATIRVTLSNDAASQVLGSSDVVAPAGYTLPPQTIALTPPATATIVGSTIQLRSLGLAPLSSFTFDVVATVPCVGNAPWSVDARRSADHSGTIGFQLDAAGSDLNTDVTGQCSLAFVTGPANAELGSDGATQSEPITGAPYDPAGPSVAVEVLDAVGQRSAASTAPVTLGLQGGTSGAILRLGGSTPVTVPAVQGLATFTGLTVDLVGFDYALDASSPGIVSALSGPFNVMQFGQICGGETCSSPTAGNPSGTTSGSATATGVTPGTELSIAFAGDDPCSGTGYSPVTPDTFTVLALTGGQPSEDVVLQVTIGIDRAQLGGRRLPQLEVCYATDIEGKTFLDKSGNEVAQGLLPICQREGQLNCVVSKTKERGTGDVTIVFVVLDGRGKI
jgi:hypothetical protein